MPRQDRIKVCDISESGAIIDGYVIGIAKQIAKSDISESSVSHHHHFHTSPGIIDDPASAWILFKTTSK